MRGCVATHRPFPSVLVHGLSAFTFFYCFIVLNGVWLAVMDEAERLLGPAAAERELGYNRRAWACRCHRALFRAQVGATEVAGGCEEPTF